MQNDDGEIQMRHGKEPVPQGEHMITEDEARILHRYAEADRGRVLGLLRELAGIPTVAQAQPFDEFAEKARQAAENARKRSVQKSRDARLEKRRGQNRVAKVSRQRNRQKH